MKTKAIIVVLVLLALAAASFGQSPYPPDPFEIQFRKVRDDIYVGYRPFPLRVPVHGNITIIINDTDVVVVDSGLTPLSAERVIAQIRKLTDKPVRYLINTHNHGDHTFGNQAFVKAFPGSEIIARQETRESLIGDDLNFVKNYPQTRATRVKTAEENIARLKAEAAPGNQRVISHLEQYWHHDIDRLQAEYGRFVATPPTLIVSENLRLHRGSRTIDILHLGAGDTPADLIVYLPQERVVCTGDMVVHPIPYGYSQQPLVWLKTLGKLSELDFEYLIPGHGEVQNGKAYLLKLMSLLQSVQTQVKAGIDAGLDVEATRKRVDLSKFEDEFAGDDPIHRYYFLRYFSNPSIEQTFNSLKAEMGRK